MQDKINEAFYLESGSTLSFTDMNLPLCLSLNQHILPMLFTLLVKSHFQK